MKLLMILTVISATVGRTDADCNAYYGPPGSRECVIIDGYNGQAQWATCLTDTYINIYSKNEHQCENRLTKFCYYQCMMELYSIRYGDVTGYCKCNGTSVTPPPESTTIIPDTCYSPPGDDCSWYRNCLEKRYPCKKQGESYAIDYAEKFCNLYDEHYSSFNAVGRQWVDAVRKCLQVKLVPILRPFVTATCDEIKKTAMDSHTDCYLSPDDQAPSICNIGIQNWMRVFMTIKSAFKDVPFESLKQSILIGSKCVSSWVTTGIQHLKIDFSGKNVFEEKLLNSKIVEPLAANGKWTNNGIRYIGYSTGEDDSSFEMVVLIMPAKQYDLNYDGALTANATYAALKATDAVLNGKVQFKLPGNVKALNFSVCEDAACALPIKSVEVPAITSSAERTGPHCMYILFYVCYFIVKKIIGVVMW